MTKEQDDETIQMLAEKVHRMEDLEELRRLYIDYGRHLDDGDTEAYAQLFAADAKLRLGPVMKADGRTAIKEAAAKVIGASSSGPGRSVHLIDSPRLTLEGDTASGECVWAAVSYSTDGQPKVIVGRHVDKFVREGGRWRFSERKGLLDVGALG